MGKKECRSREVHQQMTRIAAPVDDYLMQRKAMALQSFVSGVSHFSLNFKVIEAKGIPNAENPRKELHSMLESGCTTYLITPRISFGIEPQMQ